MKTLYLLLVTSADSLQKAQLEIKLTLEKLRSYYWENNSMNIHIVRNRLH